MKKSRKLKVSLYNICICNIGTEIYIYIDREYKNVNKIYYIDVERATHKILKCRISQLQ